MSHLVSLLDGLLAVVALEAVLLLLWRRRSGAGLPAAELLPTLLAGAGLMLAWRASAAGAPALWVGAAMALAGVAHAIDLGRRWRRGRRSLAQSPPQTQATV